MEEVEKILIIADNKFFNCDMKIKTISLNNTNFNSDIIAYYENDTFRIDNYKIIENRNNISLEYLSSLNNIEYTKNENLITLKYYYLDPYLKLAYILYILGYKFIGIYGLDIIETSNFYRKTIPNNSISIHTLNNIYSSSLFSKFIKKNNINIILIEDDLVLCSDIKRMTINNFVNNIIEYIYPDTTLCNFLFKNNEDNINFLKKYSKILTKKQFNLEKLLTSNYLIINKDIIDINIIKEYNTSLKSKIEITNDNLFKICTTHFLGLPINYKDYNTIKEYYKFNCKIYKIYLNDNNFNNLNDFDLFIHFLMFENEKFIFNFPEEFNYLDYLDLNPDLHILNSPKLILKHFLNTGIIELRNIYKNIENFDWNLYCVLNDFDFKDKYSAEYHYIKYGKKLNLLSSESLPKNFDINSYIKCNPELKSLQRIDIIKHFIKNGRDKFNYIRLPLNFNTLDYIKLNPDIKIDIKNDKEIINHFINNGIYENRLAQVIKVNYKKRILCICHNGNMQIFKKLEKYIDNLLKLNSSEIEVTLFINTINTFNVSEINYIKKKFPYAKHIIVPNFGFDIASFFTVLKICKENNLEFDYVIKIHTKTNDLDREKLLIPILGSVNRIKIILDIFNNNNIGLIGSLSSMFYNYDKLAIHNQNHLKYLLDKFNLSINYELPIQFIGGTMFWIKYEVLKKIFWSFNFDEINTELNNDKSFDWNWYVIANNIKTKITTKEEALKHYINYGKINNLSPNIFHALNFNTKSHKIRDGMIEHAYERFFSYAVENYNYIQYFIQEKSFIDILNIKPLPIVFPQFHNIPENNKFWGENFTEWTLLNKVTQDYTGKVLSKPHKSLDYYNILDETYIKKTELLLKEYNIPFLCYYHYWFKGDKVMYKPIESIRDHSKPNVDYCLFWANETWSSRWDGTENNILIKQEYGNKEDWVKHINYLITFFKDPKYIKINSKPLFLIYRPIDIPINIFNDMILLFNDKLKLDSFEGLHLIISYNNNNIEKYDEYVNHKLVSGVLDFNPNYTNLKNYKYYQEVDDNIIFEKNNDNIIFDEKTYLNYNPDVAKALENKQIQSAKIHYENLSECEKKSRIYKSNLANIIGCYEIIENEPKKHLCQLYSTFMDWNNTPRRDINKVGVKPTIFLNASPNLFKNHLKKLIFKVIKEPNQDINYILINAWNEWNEQTCLEPSDINGYKYIDAVRDIFSEYY